MAHKNDDSSNIPLIRISRNMMKLTILIIALATCDIELIYQQMVIDKKKGGSIPRID